MMMMMMMMMIKYTHTVKPRAEMVNDKQQTKVIIIKSCTHQTTKTTTTTKNARSSLFFLRQSHFLSFVGCFLSGKNNLARLTLSKVLFCSFLIVSRSFSQRSSSVINLVRAQKKE